MARDKQSKKSDQCLPLTVLYKNWYAAYESLIRLHEGKKGAKSLGVLKLVLGILAHYNQEIETRRSKLKDEEENQFSLDEVIRNAGNRRRSTIVASIRSAQKKPESSDTDSDESATESVGLLMKR
jgi:hypothetical protein